MVAGGAPTQAVAAAGHSGGMEPARGVVAVRSLPRGLLSRTFAVSQLEDALNNRHLPMYADIDSEGYLCAAGGAAALAVSARLAPHVHATHAVLTLASLPAALALTATHTAPTPPPAALALSSPPALLLRVVRDLPPLHELLLWFDERLLAAADMPFLTLGNIRGKRNYECHECGERFEEPNPLKTHLFLQCERVGPARLWRRLTARLAPPPAPAPPAGVLPEEAAARLEALAAEWGRARGGHACVYCGKLYSRKYGLKIHIRTHTGYRPLRCRHCARAFGDPSNLNKHVRLHAGGGGGHGCAGCGRVLARRRDLARHRHHCRPPPPPPTSGN